MDQPHESIKQRTPEKPGRYSSKTTIRKRSSTRCHSGMLTMESCSATRLTASYTSSPRLMVERFGRASLQLIYRRHWKTKEPLQRVAPTSPCLESRTRGSEQAPLQNPAFCAPPTADAHGKLLTHRWLREHRQGSFQSPSVMRSMEWSRAETTERKKRPSIISE